MPALSASNSYLILTLGIFLKLLGFFVVMVSYADLEPIKMRQAEYSLQDRFGINLALPFERGGMGIQSPLITQQLGRSFDTIKQELSTQVDFLGTEDEAHSKKLVLNLNADTALPLNGAPAKSPNFAGQLVDVLKTQKPDHAMYQVRVTGINGQPQVMMRALGDFIQKMVAAGYPITYLTIGYQQDKKVSDSLVKVEITAVPL